ncbi:MAG: CPBP family intramembrane metalloprotease [Spirochaetales bacterium]|nr:CPBP family intramembrane metalloprotease [Spirochaetales bacterium]
MMNHIDPGAFTMLLVMGLLGGLAIMPYSTALKPDVVLSPGMFFLSLIQMLVVTAFVVWAGMKLAAVTGLGILPLDIRVLAAAVPAGLLAGFLILTLEYYVFAPRLPEALKALSGSIPFWKRLLACFYGGMNEEIMMRWFLMGLLAWGLGRFWSDSGGVPARGAFWAANIIAALIFGLAHLPAVVSITRLTPFLLFRTLLLNGIGGFVFGWFFWKYGLLTAMVSHFCADLMLHIVAPLFRERP